jgi:hypothetical protein
MATWRTTTRVARAPAVAPLGTGWGAGDGEVSRARWAGVGVVVFALLAAIILAATAPVSQSEGQGAALAPQPTWTAAASTPGSSPAVGVPALAPVIVPPTELLTRDPRIDVIVTLPDLAPRSKGLRVKLLRDGRAVGSVRARGSEVSVADVKLRPGANRLTAVIVGPGGDGPASEAVVVTLDREAPFLRVTSPRAEQVVDVKQVVVRGRTEAGAAVTIENAARGGPVDLTADGTGTFKWQVALATGRNSIAVTVADDLGNVRREVRRVVRSAVQVETKLTLRPARMRLSKLPKQVLITLVVTDARGRPVADAPVTFTIGPQGQPVETFETSTDRQGRAVWPRNIVREGAQRGTGKVTASVTLSDGTERTTRKDLVFE